ncbi:MAG: flagellar basal body rod protein FlgC [Candidatus Marinimicrobia bacterium]|nr:flagellar basal body rod protein FlgC [Candidatus Neomarinimicrobiota bacterium]
MKIQGLFTIFNHVARGMTDELTRLETVSENISNANQIAAEGEPLYHRKSVDPRSRKQSFGSFFRDSALKLRRTSGGHISGISDRVSWYGERWPESRTIEHPNERVVYDPTHPKANAQGYVRTPDINIVQEMMDMITATRSYEANSTVLGAAKQIAKRTLEL